MRLPKLRDAAPFLVVVATLLVTLARSLREPNQFSMAHWLFDYRFGFMKRGLVGSLCSIASEITGQPMTPGVILVLSSLLMTLFALALLLLLWKSMTRLPDTPSRWLTALVFASCPFVVQSGHLMGYFDNLIYLLAIAAIALVLSGRPLAGAAASAVAMLVHENYLLVGLPMVALASFLRCRDGAPPARWLRHAAGLVLPVAVFAVINIALLHDRLELRQHLLTRMAGFEFLGKMGENAAYWHTNSFGYYWDLGIGHFRERLFTPSSISAALPSLLTLLLFMHATFRLRPFGLESLAVILTVLAPLALLTMAWDGPRVSAFPLGGALLALWILSRTRPSADAGLQVLLIAIPALLVNIFSRAPLMDDQVERFSDLRRMAYYLPAVALTFALLLRHVWRAPPDAPPARDHAHPG